jgi:hypothetical protein
MEGVIPVEKRLASGATFCSVRSSLPIGRKQRNDPVT